MNNKTNNTIKMSENAKRRVKNKSVAELQISAEQLLLEAYERKEQPLQIPHQKIVDLEEVSLKKIIKKLPVFFSRLTL